MRGLLLREGRGGKRGGNVGGGEGEEGGEIRRRREGRGGLSGNVAEEAFCLKSAPAKMIM